MKNENRTPLTLLEACTLMAREAVSLLESGEDALDSGIEFRDALALLHSTQNLGDGGALLAWVDHELESARRFAKTGERTESLVRLDAPLPLPDPAAQLDTVWIVLGAAAQGSLTEEQWQTTLNAVRSGHQNTQHPHPPPRPPLLCRRSPRPAEFRPGGPR